MRVEENRVALSLERLRLRLRFGSGLSTEDLNQVQRYRQRMAKKLVSVPQPKLIGTCSHRLAEKNWEAAAPRTAKHDYMSQTVITCVASTIFMEQEQTNSVCPYWNHDAIDRSVWF